MSLVRENLKVEYLEYQSRPKLKEAKMDKMTIDQEVKLWDQIKKVRAALEDSEKYFSKGKKGFN